MLSSLSIKPFSKLFTITNNNTDTIEGIVLIFLFFLISNIFQKLIFKSDIAKLTIFQVSIKVLDDGAKCMSTCSDTCRSSCSNRVSQSTCDATCQNTCSSMCPSQSPQGSPQLPTQTTTTNAPIKIKIQVFHSFFLSKQII